MSGSGGGEEMGQALASLIQFIFSLLFPVIFITACAVSYVLTVGFHLPQFALLAYLPRLVVSYAETHSWAMLGLGAFVVAAFPLTWVAYKEHATRLSAVIGAWVGVAVFGGGLVWMTNAWAYDRSNLQQWVFAFVLLMVWTGVCEAALGTVKLIAQTRPQIGPELVQTQKAHGHARLAGEMEATLLLKRRH